MPRTEISVLRARVERAEVTGLQRGFVCCSSRGLKFLQGGPEVAGIGGKAGRYRGRNPNRDIGA